MQEAIKKEFMPNNIVNQQRERERERAFAAGCAISNSRKIAFPSLVTTIPDSNKVGKRKEKEIRSQDRKCCRKSLIAMTLTFVKKSHFSFV